MKIETALRTIWRLLSTIEVLVCAWPGEMRVGLAPLHRGV